MRRPTALRTATPLHLDRPRMMRHGMDLTLQPRPPDLGAIARLWPGDPDWTNPGDGVAVSAAMIGGSIATSGAYLDPALGLVTPEGVLYNYASIPHDAALNVQDWCAVFQVTMNDYTPAATRVFGGKWAGNGGRSFDCYLATTGRVQVGWSADGTTGTYDEACATSLPTANGAEVYVAIGMDVDDGAGGHAYQVWLSSDGSSWSQLGSTRTHAGVASIFPGTAALSIAAIESGGFGTQGGSTARAWFYAGCGINAAGPTGTKLVEIDFRRTRGNQFTCATGQTVTVHNSYNPQQSSAGSRPTFRAANTKLGGRSGLDFDGGDVLAAISAVSIPQPCTVVSVHAYDVLTSTPRAVVGLSDTSAGRYHGANWVTGAPVYFASMGTNLTGGLPVVNVPTLQLSYLNTTASEILAQGAQQAAGGIGSAAINQLVVGAGRAAGPTYSWYLDGHVGWVEWFANDPRTHPAWPVYVQWLRNYFAAPLTV